jgi:diacylglycerol kinase family enzyme
MVVFVNNNAAGGNGLRKWQTIREYLESRLGHPRVYILNGRDATTRIIQHELGSGETRFVAAGGDGTVNVIANTLMEIASPAQRNRIHLGAIGIGSSNDFHKPLRRNALLDGVPLAINFDHARRRDVGCLTYVDQGKLRQRHFLVNASIGLTANANAFFNAPDPALSVLKRRSTEGAILYSALRTIFRHRNTPVRIQSEQRMHQDVRLTNLGIIKNPWFSGNLSYGGVAEYDNGTLDVYLCHSMKPGALVHLLRNLQRGVFPQSGGKTDVWRTESVTVSAAEPFAVEFDGEIVHTHRARFDVVPRCLRVCS